MSATQMLLREFHDILGSPEYQEHPSLLGRILFFVIPVVIYLASEVIYEKQIEVVNRKYDIIPMGETWSVNIMKLTSVIAIFIAGIEAIVDDAWSTKAWILFAVGLFFLTIWNPVYQEGSLFALNITAVFTVFAVLAFEWLWIQLDGMPEGTWKHISKNLIGYFLAMVLVAALADLGQVSIYSCGMGYRVQAIFFWVFTPAIFICLIIYNSIRHPPFIDSIGLIVGAIVALLNSLTSTLRYKEKERLFELSSKQ